MKQVITTKMNSHGIKLYNAFVSIGKSNSQDKKVTIFLTYQEPMELY